MAKTAEAASPEAKLAGAAIEVDAATLGNVALAMAGSATYVPGIVDGEAKAALDADLDPKRVRKKPGKNLDYLAVHDVVRTANRIFGFGRWGHEVVELECVGTHQVKNGKGEQGWYTGYRCTVRLTVAGCVPVMGVGYGDAFEKQWSGAVTTHELAVKEAESDALKRAFKNFGDQFGLILYAKDDEKRLIEQARAEEQYNAAAPDADVEELRSIAQQLGNEAMSNALDAEVQEHGRARAGWIARALPKARQLAAEGAQPETASQPAAADAVPAAQEPRSQEYTGADDNQPAPVDSAPQAEDTASAADVATDAQVRQFMELAGKLGEKGHAHANGLIVEHLAANGNVVSGAWLAEQTANVVKALQRAGLDPNTQQQLREAFATDGAS